jgi:hypothetical protein
MIAKNWSAKDWALFPKRWVAFRRATGPQITRGALVVGVVFLAALFSPANAAAQAQSADLVTTRVLTGRVIGLDDKPSSGVVVGLFGRNSRMGPYNFVEPLSRYSPKTDAEGRFRIELGNGVLIGDANPVAGFFCLLILPAPDDKHAGACGPLIVLQNPPAPSGEEATAPDNLTLEDRFESNARLIRMDLRLGRGYILLVQTLDEEGKPLPGVGVSVNQSLDVDSHTGFGGDYFSKEAAVNTQGKATIPSIPVAPTEIHLSSPQGYEAAGKYRFGDGEWRTGGFSLVGHNPLGGASPRPMTSEPERVELTVVFQKIRERTIQLTIKNSSGEPIPNAKVAFSVGLPSDPHSDSHTFIEEKTNENGEVSRRIEGYRYLNFVKITAEGYEIVWEGLVQEPHWRIHFPETMAPDDPRRTNRDKDYPYEIPDGTTKIEATMPKAQAAPKP